MSETAETQALVPAPSAPSKNELAAIKEQVRLIANTEFVPKALRGNPHATLACILYGREIGLGPMESLSEVNMIDGRPSLSAKSKVKRARQAGHSIRLVEEADDHCTVHGKRGDNDDEMDATYTVAMAKRAGLLEKPNWKKHPEDMLWARAVSRLCRRLFDDVPGLGMLDPDEAELTDAERDQEQMDDVLAVTVQPGAGPVDAEPEMVEGEVVEDAAPDRGEEEVAPSATDAGQAAATATLGEPEAASSAKSEKKGEAGGPTAPASPEAQGSFPLPQTGKRRNPETGE